MKFETKIINFFAGCLQIPIPAALIALIGELQQAANGGKVLEVEIKIKRKRRSLNANAYLWEVLGRMAAVLKTDKDSVYLMMLERYGVYTHVCVKPARRRAGKTGMADSQGTGRNHNQRSEGCAAAMLFRQPYLQQQGIQRAVGRRAQ